MSYTIMKYLRISAEDIDLDGFDKYESNSISNQRAYLDDFIGKTSEFDGCEVVEEIDDGRTGTNFSRPGVQRVLELVKSGAVQCIIVKDLSRFGRNYLEVGDYLEQQFPAWGVRFISINDMYDSARHSGGIGAGTSCPRIDIAFRNLVYEMYSQDLSEKVKSARLAAAKSGKTCSPYPFYGYLRDPADPRKLIVDEAYTASIVRRIFRMAAAGNTGTQIARAFNDENIPTPQQRQKALGGVRKWSARENNFWSASMITKLLGDERYTGKQIFGKMRVTEMGKPQRTPVPRDEWVVIPGAIPAIIDEAEFTRVRELVHARYNANCVHQKSTTLLFSKKIRCGKCGLAMRVSRRQVCIKYQCGNFNQTDKYGCTNDYILEKDVVDAVLSMLRQRSIFADTAKRDLADKSKKSVSKAERLRGEVSRLKKILEKSTVTKMELWEKYHSGSISAEAFHRDSEKITEQAETYAAKIPELERQAAKLELENGCESTYIERFSRHAVTQTLTREMVEEFVKEIRVYAPDRIEVVLNYAEDYEKIAMLIGDDAK